MIFGTIALVVSLSVSIFCYMVLGAVVESAYTYEIVVGTTGVIPLIYALGMIVERKVVMY